MNRVQSGTATIANGASSTTASITSVTISQAILVFSARLESTVVDPATGQVSGQLTNSTTVTFARTGTVGVIVIEWYVADFSGGVSVQRGSSAISGVTTNVPISSVNTAKSFVLATVRTTGTIYGRDDYFEARLTSPTNLQFNIPGIGGVSPTIEWQVVEYTQSNVQSGQVSFLTTDASKTATVTSVNTSKSWLLYSCQVGNNATINPDVGSLRGQLTDATTLTFDRDATGQTALVTYFLVEFTDGTTVQQGTQNFTSTETQKDVTIGSVDTSLAFVTAGNYMRAGKTPYATDDNVNPVWFTLGLTSATNLRITRGVTGSATADAGWSIVQFPATYYSKGSLDVSTASNWNSKRDGTGTDASTFGTGTTWKIQNGHSMTLAGSTPWDVSASGAVEIESGGSWTNSSSGTVTIGTLQVDNGATYTHSNTNTLPGTTRSFGATSTVDYAGTAQAVAAATYGHLILSNSGTKTFAGSPVTVQGNLTTSGTAAASLSSNLTVNGNASIGSGTTFTGGSGAIDINGSLTASGTAFTATSGNLNVAGDFSITAGSFTHNSGTIVLDGANTTISAASATLNNLTVSRVSQTNAVNLGASLTVAGTVSITNGWLIQDSSSLTAGAVSISTTGKLRNWGTGTLTLGGNLSNSGAVDFNGGGDGNCGSATKAQIRSTVGGTQRSWSGSGTFQMVDVDVMDQAGSAAITCYGSTNSGNNGANWTIGSSCVGAPTAVTLISFAAAEREDGSVLLQWRTGYEVDNLGFHVYREDGGQRVRITPSLVAGSALFEGTRIQRRAGRSYAWRDTAVAPGAWVSYWLEDVDLHGRSTWHGPVTPEPAGLPGVAEASSVLLSQLGRRKRAATSVGARSQVGVADQVAASGAGAGAPEAAPGTARQGPETVGMREERRRTQWRLAAQAAVKIGVRAPGWYRVSPEQLFEAGLSREVDPRTLQLYADGLEQAIKVRGEADGRLDAADWLEFYGTGLDTPWTDERTYWLVAGRGAGKRSRRVEAGTGDPAGAAQGFAYTVEKQDRSIYFAALLNGEAPNFFGPLVSSESLDEHVSLAGVDQAAGWTARLEVGLQGVTMQRHDVRVWVNDVDAGWIGFEGQENVRGQLAVPQAVLTSGDNVVRLLAAGGSTDVSLVDGIRLTYWHTETADGTSQRYTLPAHQPVTIRGFASPSIRAVDVTDPNEVRELRGEIEGRNGRYALRLEVPGWEAADVLLFTEAGVLSPARVEASHPSTWHAAGPGADVLIVSPAAWVDSLGPLQAAQEREGWRVVRVAVEDLYDEFSFGARTPWAIKDFVGTALGSWRRAPTYLVLVGDATIDPRDYLGLGDVEGVPAPLVDTQYLETASDDWYAELGGSDLPRLVVGRLPVRTEADAARLVDKLVRYRQAGTGGAWAQQALLVSGAGADHDFGGASQEIASLLAETLTIQAVRADKLGEPAARPILIEGLRDGSAVVNYFGHGSVERWAGDLLTSADARDLANGNRLPLMVLMTCLNGLFVDPYAESLGEALLEAPLGGAMGVWASSGLTDLDVQEAMSLAFYRNLLRRQVTIGEALWRAKAETANADVRHTWIYLGDPTMRSPLAPARK